MPFIDFTTGQVLTADQMDLVMRQSVMRFADAATRDTALADVLAEGMIAYLDDTNEVLKYNGTDWIAIGPETITAQGDIIVGDAGGDASRLALGTAGQILESNGTALSYVTPDSSPDDIITTQGDLIIGDASGDAVRLPVGLADQVLISDGTTVSFADAGGGMELITSGSVSSAVLDITSLPQTFKTIFIVMVGNVGDLPKFRINNNSDFIYDEFNENSSPATTGGQGRNAISVGSRAGTGTSSIIIELPFYNSGLNQRLFATMATTNTATNPFAGRVAGFARSTDSINRIASATAMTVSFQVFGVK